MPIKERMVNAAMAIGYAECCLDSGYIDLPAFIEISAMITAITEGKGYVGSVELMKASKEE